MWFEISFQVYYSYLYLKIFNMNKIGVVCYAWILFRYNNPIRAKCSQAVKATDLELCYLRLQRYKILLKERAFFQKKWQKTFQTSF